MPRPQVSDDLVDEIVARVDDDSGPLDPAELTFQQQLRLLIDRHDELADERDNLQQQLEQLQRTGPSPTFRG
jgi:hypothetical protein